MSNRSRAGSLALPMLPIELLEAICGHCSVQALVKARLACTALREPAADRIETLQAPGCCLPPVAWRVYPKATSAVVKPCKGDRGGQLERLLGLLASLPQRLESLTIQGNAGEGTEEAVGGGSAAFDRFLVDDVEQSRQLERALLESPCAAGLHHLTCKQRLCPAASTALAQGLPELRSLSLVVSCLGQGEESSSESDDPDADELEDGSDDEEATWPSAALQVGLTSLVVAADNSCGRTVRVDCARLAAAQQLRCLSIDNTDTLRHPEALAQLTALTSVHLWHADAEMWGVLLQLPQLQRLQCDSVVMDLELLPDVRLAHLTSFGTKDITIERPEEDERLLLPGCLARLMPQLKRLDVVSSCDDCRLRTLLAALQGLAGLQELELEGGADWEVEIWRQQPHLLGSLSGLTSLDLKVRAELGRVCVLGNRGGVG
jgi:hypothetical protein